MSNYSFLLLFFCGFCILLYVLFYVIFWFWRMNFLCYFFFSFFFCFSLGDVEAKRIEGHGQYGKRFGMRDWFLGCICIWPRKLFLLKNFNCILFLLFSINFLFQFFITFQSLQQLITKQRPAAFNLILKNMNLKNK